MAGLQEGEILRSAAQGGLPQNDSKAMAGIGVPGLSA